MKKLAKGWRSPERTVFDRNPYPGRHYARMVAAVAVGASMTACASGAHLRPPAPKVVPSQTAEAMATAHAEAHWWQGFGSPELVLLIEEALRASPTVAAAEATLRQAGAMVAVRAGVNRLPQADASVGAQRQRMNPAALGQPGDPREFAVRNATVSMRYRLDLSGGNTRLLQALSARADFHRFQLAGARLTLAASIATAAVQHAQLSAQLEASRDILQRQNEELVISGERVRLGAASPDEVFTNQARVAQTRADVLAQQSLLQQNAHLIAVLAGRKPGVGVQPHFLLSELTLPTALPAVIPSELVRRRPDIQAAEALMRAANAEYGVAAAKLYPQLDLSAALGSQALSSGVLFGAGTAVWTVATQLTQPLFTPGARAEKSASLAAFDAAASHYQSVVLESLRNTADLLTALEYDAQMLVALNDAYSVSQASLAITQRQYALGAVSYRTVLIAEQQARQTHIAVSVARSKQLLNAIALHHAVGGAPERPRTSEAAERKSP
jgi:NodT family efflux transporter outer membrane factor (OMF) lipoprotein